MKRRTFLARTGGLALLVPPAARTVLSGDSVPAFLANSEEETLAAVMDIVLPTGADSPGAREVRATEYLFTIISDPDIEPSDRKFLREGIGFIDSFAKEKTGARFAALAPEKRLAVFEQFVAEERGENWVSMLISYSLEALFGDPAYGVNVNEAGWKWIGHTPGFPHPPGRKWYKKI